MAFLPTRSFQAPNSKPSFKNPPIIQAPLHNCALIAFLASLAFTAVIALIASLAFTAASSSHPANSSCPPSSCAPTPTTLKSLKYYVHAQDNSAYNIVNASIPGVSTFGNLAAFDYTITQEQNATSKQFGSIRGLELYSSLDPSVDATVFVMNTVTYADGIYNGTVSLHGQASINHTSYDITVVGGTGDFRGVRGYAAVTNLETPHGSDHIIEHVVHFL